MLADNIEDNISFTDHLVFVSPCVLVKVTHYPMLEKPLLSFIATCENYGKQRELSDH